jgi:hypothetical protein
MLAHLDREYDGARGYLRTIGLSGQDIDRIASRLRSQPKVA